MSEADVIAAALSRSAFAALEHNRRAAAEADVEQAGMRTNPVASIGRDGLSSSGGREAETRLEISQPLDLAGRRQLSREAAALRADATDAESATARAKLVADVRRAFADALFRNHSVAALEQAITRLTASAAIVRKLAEGGEASGYDRRRVTRELLTLKVQRETVVAALARDRSILAAYLDGGVAHELETVGPLLPAAPPPLDQMQARLRGGDRLLALNVHATAADSDARLARRAWIPDVSLGIGNKLTETRHGERDDLSLSLEVSLPLFDRGQARLKRAIAERETYRAEHALQVSTLSAELEGAWQKAQHLHATALEFRRQALGNSHELGRIAQTAYGAGEGGILDLIDASRTELETELLSLDLDHQARMARIELDHIAGVNNHE